MLNRRKVALLSTVLVGCLLLNGIAIAEDNAQSNEPVSAKKSCEQLKSEIDTKLQAKGVASYSLDIVSSESVQHEKVVGSCDVGTKKITYKRS